MPCPKNLSKWLSFGPFERQWSFLGFLLELLLELFVLLLAQLL
jgi:hypothetical protein